MNSSQQQQAIDLNSKAVSLLQIGRTNEAMTLLRGAAIFMRDLSSAKKDSLTPAQSSKQELSSSIQSVELLHHSFALSSTADNTVHSMYDHALTFVHFEPNIDIISAVVLYNMALINHLHGLRTSSFLSTSLRLYETAFIILKNSKMLGPHHLTHHSVNLLRLALVNNLAHAHSLLFDSERVADCLGFMRYILEDDKSITFIQHDDSYNNDSYSFFYMNATVFSGHVLALAPAA